MARRTFFSLMILLGAVLLLFGCVTTQIQTKTDPQPHPWYVDTFDITIFVPANWPLTPDNLVGQPAPCGTYLAFLALWPKDQNDMDGGTYYVLAVVKGCPIVVGYAKIVTKANNASALLTEEYWIAKDNKPVKRISPEGMVEYLKEIDNKIWQQGSKQSI